MAYGIKYIFRFDSENGVQYTVNLLKDGFSGSATIRPLGKTPVVRMQESGPFRATSCNLVLECQTDGEFAELYTSDPLQYRVDIFRGGSMGVGGTLIWSGFVATELYSEPDIAPPYDVSITATDGLGILKEFDFDARGLQKVREHIGFFLRKTGLDQGIYCVTSEGPTSGSPITLFDSISINMDYKAGENCYDVFEELLRTFHLTVTSYSGNWLLIRETDVAGKLNNAGDLSVYSVPSRAGSSSSTTTATLAGAKKTIGQMGVADVWPVGYLTRRVVPAKSEVSVEAPWYPVNGAPSVQDDGWDSSGYVYGGATFVSVGDGNSYYNFGTSGATGHFSDVIFASLSLSNFTKTIDIKIRASLASGQTSGGILGAHAQFMATGASSIISYAGPEYGWGAYATNDSAIPRNTVDVQTDLASEAQEVVISIPPPVGYTSGTLTIYIVGRGIRVFDVSIIPNLNKGYLDRIVIDNNARGKDDRYVITGGRALNGYIVAATLYNGLFVWTAYPDTAVYDWADNRQYGVNFLSLTALDYALSIAAPRVELSGRFDLPAGLILPPVVLDLRSVLYQIKTYDWDLRADEISFTAVSVPAASLTVDSETVIPIPND